MVDYFGNERSTLWDTMEEMRDENAKMEEEKPGLYEEISQLEAKLAVAKRKTTATELFKAADPEGTVS